MSDAELEPRSHVPRALAPFFASMQERALALGSLRDAQAAPQLELLAFAIGGEGFALEVAAIVEVVRLMRPFPLPQVGPEVLGVMGLRGAMVPLLELGRMVGVVQAPLGAPSTEAPGAPGGRPGAAPRHETGRRVVVLRDAAPLGLVVDRVLGVARVHREKLAPAPPQGQGLLIGLGHGTSYGTLRVLNAALLLGRCARLG